MGLGGKQRPSQEAVVKIKRSSAKNVEARMERIRKYDSS